MLDNRQTKEQKEVDLTRMDAEKQGRLKLNMGRIPRPYTAPCHSL